MLVVEEEVDLRVGQRQAVPKPVLIGDEGVVVPWEISPTLSRRRRTMKKALPLSCKCRALLRMKMDGGMFLIEEREVVVDRVIVLAILEGEAVEGVAVELDLVARGRREQYRRRE
ncbi:BTB domain and ankyrin repeat protein [Histoplasma capsulatum var. duboisii H88]|uniref:BTB domain and ankyrin repeat protein n=1 Tax=Ajellomyces capsulatus (strain H88) TaxID=544711 RepID=A0A8A1LZ01_AJEC8|nr:BTB domain and ankyrin repeat protein [Histoplasma capsulatum var. duboisii H88]